MVFTCILICNIILVWNWFFQYNQTKFKLLTFFNKVLFSLYYKNQLLCINLVWFSLYKLNKLLQKKLFNLSLVKKLNWIKLRVFKWSSLTGCSLEIIVYHNL